MSAFDSATTAQIDKANESGRRPAVFIHGLWLLASSWEPWARVFEDAGYAPVLVGWPDDPSTVALGNEHPEVFARKTVGQVADHYAAVMSALTKRPVVIGHSFGGLLTQIVAGRGLAAASVAIDAAPFRGVLPLPLSALKSSLPVLGNPRNRSRAVSLTFSQFRYSFTNAVGEVEAKALFDSLVVPAPGAPLFQAALANVNPWTQLKVDVRNPERGPLLIVSGQEDHIAPTAIAKASFNRQRKNPGVTEFLEIKGRGHSLVFDGGWREVADAALSFVQRFAT